MKYICMKLSFLGSVSYGKSTLMTVMFYESFWKQIETIHSLMEASSYSSTIPLDTLSKKNLNLIY